MDPLGPAIQAILFALFSALTLLLSTITGPTYEGLVVPELAPSALFPTIGASDGSFLDRATAFSESLLVHLVDPAIVLIVLGIGLLYLAHAVLGRETARLESLLPTLLVYVVLANLTVPVAGAVLGLAGAAYPTIAGFDGGAWQVWANLDGFGGLKFSWDNGALAFIVSFILFSLVLLIAIALAVRDALLGVLLVLLPAFTLLGALPTFRPLARKAWMMFGEAAFLPCVMVVPLELAVGSPSILLLLGYLTISVGAPSLISAAGGQLAQAGFPSAGSAVTGGIQRGLSFVGIGAASYVRPLGERPGAKGGSRLPAALAQAARAPFPLSAPLAFGELMGRGARHLVRHIHPPKAEPPRAARHAHRRFRPVVRGSR